MQWLERVLARERREREDLEAKQKSLVEATQVGDDDNGNFPVETRDDEEDDQQQRSRSSSDSVGHSGLDAVDLADARSACSSGAAHEEQHCSMNLEPARRLGSTLLSSASSAVSNDDSSIVHV